MIMESEFGKLKPERPKRLDNFTPHVHFSEEEIHKMKASGMTEKQIVDEWVKAINTLAQSRLEEEKEKGKDKA